MISYTDVDGVEFRLSIGINNLFAVHTAMVEGSFSAEHFTDALFCAAEYLEQVRDTLKGLIDAARPGNKPAEMAAGMEATA